MRSQVFHSPEKNKTSRSFTSQFSGQHSGKEIGTLELGRMIFVIGWATPFPLQITEIVQT
jgi:hypothetical protein